MLPCVLCVLARSFGLVSGLPFSADCKIWVCTMPYAHIRRHRCGISNMFG